MTVKKHIFAGVAVVVLILAAAGARAQDSKPSPTPVPTSTISPEKLALIKELMELTSSQKTIDAVLQSQADEMERRLPDEVWATASAMPEVARLSTLDRESLRIQVMTSALETSRKVNELIKQRVDFNKLIADISVPLHDKYFTEAELRDLVVFYKSSTGQKVIDVMPKLLSESMEQIARTVVPQIVNAVDQLQREETERMKKEVLETVKSKAKPASNTRRSSRSRSRH
ncbi:MAG TPA: DUF2059 domain-containing protein [Pyrinomonadaceae bacterium]|nr:DUF2059 domain-containing protein [Pyrinomonadaceae bacterium]